jgi:NitT/TauT family transport system ATP-binding protein
MLEFRECSAAYGSRAALSSISLEVPDGQTACIVGPSGCGKTTLLMLAAGLKAPCAGAALFDGRPPSPGDRRVALILQNYGLFPWFTVQDNVELGLRIRGVPPAERQLITAREIAQVGLEGCESLFPRELSGGQQQRVAIARAYALQPGVLLMDEPFSALDALSRESLQDVLLDTAARRGISVLMVTHSIEEAAYLGNVIWVLAGTPGKVAGRLENPAQGSRGFRQEPEFFRTCGSLRALMERGSDVT